MQAYSSPNVITYSVTKPQGFTTAKLKKIKEDLEIQMDCQVRFTGRGFVQGSFGIAVNRQVRDQLDERHIYTGYQNLDKGKTLVPLGVTEGAGQNAGSALAINLAAAPHVLIAGTTGSGKSVVINTLVTGVLLAEENPIIVGIDPKRVSFKQYEKGTGAWKRTAYDTREAMILARTLCKVMDYRYAALARMDKVEVKNEWPKIFLVADEFADCMLGDKKVAKLFENYMVRLAQMGRAAGIHLILATQKPIATVVTPLLKGNLPGRIGLKTSTAAESRVILDAVGCETLQGYGDAILKDLKTTEYGIAPVRNDNQIAASTKIYQGQDLYVFSISPRKPTSTLMPAGEKRLQVAMINEEWNKETIEGGV